MPTTEMVVMVAIISALALGFIAILRLFGTMVTHKTIRTAVEKDPAHADALLMQLTAPRQSTGDDRIAIILVAVGIAIAGAGTVIGDPGLMRLAIAAALFPLLVGGALWLRFRALQRGAQHEPEQ
jgi:hypothetical protein